MIKKVYPSSVAFNLGGENITTKNSGCHRYRQMSYGVSFNIPEIYQEIGEINEVAWEKHLAGKGIDYEREKPFKEQLNPHTLVSGRMDFITQNCIYECKATASSSMKSKLDKGEVDKNHLAQLCLYLSIFERTKGMLVYGYYQRNNVDEIVKTKGWLFKVELSGDRGSVKVNGFPVGLDAVGLADYVMEAGITVNSDEMARAPLNDDATSWNSPCRFCPLKDLCASGEFYEGKKITATDRLKAQDVIQNQPKREAKLTKTRNKKFHKKKP